MRTSLRDPRSDGSYNALRLDSLSSATVGGPGNAVLNGSAPFTIDAWIRFNGLPAQAVILGQADVFTFGSTANTIFFQLSNGDVVASDPTQSALDEDTWHHVCAAWDGGMLHLYIDGVLNVAQTMTPTVAGNANPVSLGQGLQGLVRSLRVFSQYFAAETVVDMMFAPIGPTTANVAAWFDFSQVPPVDSGPSAFSVVPQGGAQLINVSPAMSPGVQGFARPFGDHGVNPGGAQVDPYSVQSWIYLEPGATARQAVFVNSDLASDTGMALYLDYDASASGFRLVSQRGSDGDTGQVLTSKALVPWGQWVNVATTFDGQTLALYVAGQPDSTLSCHPIPLIRTRSDLLIGAAIAQGYPSPTTALQGFIREVDVWSIALTAPQVLQYSAQLPDPTTTGFAAAYGFTSKPARNQVNGHPIGLAEGATMSGQLGPATSGEQTAPPRAVDVPEPHADFVASVRASLDLAAFVRSNAAMLQASMTADVARFDRPEDRAVMAKAWTDLVDGVGGKGPPPRFWLTRHVVDGEHLIICHRPAGSEIVSRADAASVDPCLFWHINLAFCIIFGVLDAVFGVNAKLTPAAQTYLARLMSLSALTSRFGIAAQVTTTTVFQILQTIHTLGGVSPIVRLVLDVGIWTMLRVIAHAVLVATGLGSARLLASLVITAANLAQLLQNPPAECAPMPVVTLDSIAFNYGPASAATPIRRNMLNDVAVPEWTPVCQIPGDSPAAYACSSVALAGAVSVQATFTVNPNGPATISAADGGVLGAIPQFTIPGSGTYTIALPANELAEVQVAAHDVEWTWTAQSTVQGAPASSTTTRHRIYTLLAPPTAPWVVAQNVDGQLPWTDVLDFAAGIWAATATTQDEALTQITAQVNGSIGLTYDLAAGGAHYTQAAGLQPSIFQCSMFLEFLNGGAGNGNLVNCTDCATIVTTFANVVGCDVFATRMTSFAAPTFFNCNAIISIGGGAWSPPFPNVPAPFDNGFRYHEVVQVGQPLQPSLYDACLKVSPTTDPWTAPAVGTAGLLPADIRFTTQALQPVLPFPVPFADQSYRERLATNGASGIGSCNLLGSWPQTNGGRRPVI